MRFVGFLLALLFVASPALAQQAAPVAVSPQAMAEYKKALAKYTAAQRAFEKVAGPYWDSITEKRRARNAKRRDGQTIELEDYVLTQPPVYAGPPHPVDPSKPDEEPRPRRYIPVVADFLKAAEDHYQFVPARPRSEIEFKRAYAAIASAAGLAREQAVRIYSFEAGGDGGYEVQAGLERPRPNARAISTALGYNQLLTTNSVSLLAELGHKFVAALKLRAAALDGETKAVFNRKIAIVQQMIAFSRTVPVQWGEHEKLAVTPRGYAMHALLLDIDVGPLLQTQKLMDSVIFARRKGFERPLTAAELEMMNLTGDGNGFDMVTMPQNFRDKVPTSNFFQRGGYGRNPVASRNNVVAKLIAATDTIMDREIRLKGARDLAEAFPQ